MIVYTCTTFLDHGNRFELFEKAVESILEVHSKEDLELISRFVVINEWSENAHSLFQSRTEHFREKFPPLEFIQKSKEDFGQAKSLNMIRNLLQICKAEYWIHWEESWCAKRAFIQEAMTILKEHPQISQLQLSTDIWLDSHPELSESLDLEKSVFIVKSNPNLFALVKHSSFEELIATPIRLWWPLYSLRPSINRVGAHLEVGPYIEGDEWWPCTFEMEFALRWLNAQNVKAAFKVPPVVRSEGYASTYVRDIPVEKLKTAAERMKKLPFL